LICPKRMNCCKKLLQLNFYKFYVRHCKLITCEVLKINRCVTIECPPRGRYRDRFPRRISPKYLKSWYSKLPCLTFSIKGIVSRTSRQVCLLCPWARPATKGAEPPLQHQFFLPEVSELLFVLLYLVNFAPLPNVRLLPLKYFLPHHGMFSSWARL